MSKIKTEYVIVESVREILKVKNNKSIFTWKEIKEAMNKAKEDMALSAQINSPPYVGALHGMGYCGDRED